MLAFNSATMNLDLPPGLLQAICTTESNGVLDPPRVNDGGSHSLGICQVKLGTARGVGFKGDENKLAKPQINIYQAGKILKYHLERCNTYRDAIMAYNTGSCMKSNDAYYRKVLKNAGSKN